MSYRALVGINLPPGDTRYEPGAVITQIPATLAKSWVTQGLIEATDPNEASPHHEHARMSEHHVIERAEVSDGTELSTRT